MPFNDDIQYRWDSRIEKHPAEERRKRGEKTMRKSYIRCVLRIWISIIEERKDGRKKWWRYLHSKMQQKGRK